MSPKAARGMLWFKYVMGLVLLVSCFQIISAFFLKNTGFLIVKAIIGMFGSLFIVGLPAFALGWLTGGRNSVENHTSATANSSQTSSPESNLTHSASKSISSPVPMNDASGISGRIADDAIDLARYKQAADEIENDKRNDALWYKAFAEENGVENATKAAYIRLRVEQLRCAAFTALGASSVLTEAKPNVAQEARGVNLQKRSARNLYEVLEIPNDASLITIENGYQMQMDLLDSFRYRSAEVEARRKLIHHAKDLLSDPIKRAVYDERIAISPPTEEFVTENFSFDLANDTLHEENEKIKREQIEAEKIDEAKEKGLKEKYCLGLPIYPEDVAFLKQRGATWYM